MKGIIYLSVTNYRDLRLLKETGIKYVLISAGSIWTGNKFNVKVILEAKRFAESIIIDSGAQQFLSKLESYPHIYKLKYVELDKLLDDNDFIVTLDVPLDLMPKEKWKWALWETINNAIWMWDKVKNAKLMVAIQGYYTKLSLYEKCWCLLNYFIDPEYIGIGSVCIAPPDGVMKAVRFVRSIVGKRYLHAFGPDLRTVPHIFNYINSIDTSMYHRGIPARYGLPTVQSDTYGTLTYDKKLKDLKNFIRKYHEYLFLPL